MGKKTLPQKVRVILSNIPASMQAEYIIGDTIRAEWHAGTATEEITFINLEREKITLSMVEIVESGICIDQDFS